MSRQMDQAPDARRFAPATQRNREAIAKVLASHLPSSGGVLEIASGSGEHAVYFAEHFPKVFWQPSDRDQDALESIEAWRLQASLPNLRSPVRIDVEEETLAPTKDKFDFMFCANMIHIAPWSATSGLFRLAKAMLLPGAKLLTYGPYKVDGKHTAASNASFDEMLRSEDPSWGVRSLEEVQQCASSYQLHLQEKIPMPANNFCLVWRF